MGRSLCGVNGVIATGTASEVIAMTEIDHFKVGEGRMGPITRKLQSALQQTVTGKHARSAGWLTPVAAPAFNNWLTRIGLIGRSSSLLWVRWHERPIERKANPKSQIAMRDL